MCDHKKRPKYFCVFQKCTQKQCFGCLTCIKNTHKQCRFQQFINQNGLTQILPKFQYNNEGKESQKTCNLKVYKLLTHIKNELYNKIQQAISEIMSKIKYPFLFHAQLLDTFRNVRDKNYLRLESAKLRKFYQIGKSFNRQDFGEKEILYYHQYLSQTQKQLQNMFVKLHDIQKIFNFSLHQDIKGLKMSCLKQIQLYLKAKKSPKKQVKNDTIQKPQVFCRSNTEGQKSKLQFLTPVKQRSLLSESFEYVNIKSLQTENEMKKSNYSIQNQSKQKAWRSPLSSRDEFEKKTRRLEDQIFSQRQSFNLNNSKGVKTWFDQRNQPQSKNKKLEVPIIKNLKTDKNVPNLYQYSEQSSNSMQIKISDMIKETKRPEKINGLDQPMQFVFKSTEFPKKPSGFEPKKRNYDDEMQTIRHQRQQNIKRRIQDMIKQKQTNNKKFLEAQQKQRKIKQLKLSILSDDSRIEKKPNEKQIRSPNSHQSSKKIQVKDNQKGFTSPQLRKSPKKSDNVSLNKYVVKGMQKTKDSINNVVNMKEIPLVDEEKQQKLKKSKLLRKKSLNRVEDEIEGACLYIVKVMQLKQTQKLRQFLQTYNENCANNLTAVEHLAFLYVQQGKAKECLNLTNEYLQKMDNLAFNQSQKLNLMINKSASLNMLGRYSENITFILSRLQKIQHQKLHKNLGDAYFSMNTYDKAIYHYQKAIKMNDKFDEAYYNLAVILYNQSSYFNAKMNITKALHFDPKNQFYQELFNAINQRIKMNQQN